jgi:hypothetical protein
VNCIIGKLFTKYVANLLEEEEQTLFQATFVTKSALKKSLNIRAHIGEVGLLATSLEPYSNFDVFESVYY